MTDEQIWTIVWVGGGWLLSLVGTAWFSGWWFSRQVTSGEIRELRERCNVLDQRRQFAEDKQKSTANELETVKAQLVTAQEQLKAHAPTEAIAGTIKVIESSTFAAITSNNEIGRVLRADPPKEVKMFSLTKKSNE
jgi:hypothetical protein